MLVSNKLYSIACQSCCCTAHEVDHLKKAVECADFMLNKCLCKSTACSHDTSHSTEAAALLENCQRPQLQDIGSVDHSRDSLSEAVSLDARHARCTCKSESHLLTAAHHAACLCRRRSLMHVVRCDQSVNYVPADRKVYSHHCCTCIGKSIQDLAVSSCHHGVKLSNITASLCPACIKCTLVNRPQQPNSWLTSKCSDLCSTQEQQERPGQSGSVVMDVSEWQRRHIEQLGRQKLEV